MNMRIQPGKYVVAVSGGVDSVALLYLIWKTQANQNGIIIEVAHFDHGIREDSAKDAAFVRELAGKLNLPFHLGTGKLGSSTSEERAREARYNFLREIKSQIKADAIVTAHHQDDVIETAIINLLRGTTAKGLGALKSTPEIIRPLLPYTKADIIDYAKTHHLSWREDPTNQDENYLRNYVRKKLLPKMSTKKRQNFLDIIATSSEVTAEISKLIATIQPEDGLKRAEFVALPHKVASELVASWLKAARLGLDRKTIERLVIGLKTVRGGKRLEINKNKYFIIQRGVIYLK